MHEACRPQSIIINIEGSVGHLIKVYYIIDARIGIILKITICKSSNSYDFLNFYFSCILFIVAPGISTTIEPAVPM